MGFKQLLQEKLKDISEFPKDPDLNLLKKLPNGFQELQNKIILKLHNDLVPYAKLIAEKTKELLPRTNAIWMRQGQIKGAFRKPEGLVHLLGDTGTEIINNENNIRYKFDFTKIMFAKGNIHERNLLPQRIEKGSTIVDMFSGIGYFSLGIAKKSSPLKLYSIEWNPVSYKYLCENAKLNHVESIIEPIFGDCKELVPDLAKKGVKADYIIMGLLPAPVDAIPAALSVVKKGKTIVIYEGVSSKESDELFDEFSQIAKDNGFDTEMIDKRDVKSFAPHRYHMVIEILIK